MDAYERRYNDRHIEVLDSIAKLDARLRITELEAASNKPLIRGFSGAVLLLFGALVTGYVGSLFSNVS